MHISSVITAKKIGHAYLIPDNHKKNWGINWIEKDENYLSQTLGRVYLITSNGIIKKIGGSQDKGGIKGTLNWYENGALTGGPSIRTYGIHILIKQELEKGNLVEFYCIFSKKIVSSVIGLFGEESIETSIDFKAMENKCKNDYISLQGQLPEWNFQESGKKWPIYISEECNNINKKTTDKRKVKEDNENTN